MATREDVRRRMQEDGIEYLLTQFVDIHGSAKAKMVPVSHMDDVIDTGQTHYMVEVIGNFTHCCVGKRIEFAIVFTKGLGLG